MSKIGYSVNYNKNKCKTFKLDTFCNIHKVNDIFFLKMDIEGSELSALKGASKLLSEGKVDFVQFEFGHASHAARIFLKDFFDYLNSYNYNIYVIKPNFIEKVEYDPFIENRYDMINFLAFKDNLKTKMNKIIKH